MKHSRSIIQSVIKDIIKGNRRLYWFTFTKLKYLFLSVNSFFYRKKIKSFKIFFLLPSRERSKKFIRLINSINETCLNKQKIEILLLLDEDDIELNEYKKISIDDN